MASAPAKMTGAAEADYKVPEECEADAPRKVVDPDELMQINNRLDKASAPPHAKDMERVWC